MVYFGLRKRGEEGQVVEEVLRELPQLKSYLQSKGNPIQCK